MLAPVTVAEFMAGRRVHPTPAAFAVLAYVVIFPSLIAYIFFNRGVELIGANRAGPFFHLIPVFGSAIAIAFLGERPQLYHGIGYLLIITGICRGAEGRAEDRLAEREVFRQHDPQRSCDNIKAFVRRRAVLSPWEAAVVRIHVESCAQNIQPLGRSSCGPDLGRARRRSSRCRSRGAEEAPSPRRPPAAAVERSG